MKARSVLQKKDIFLSYAHMNIEFARRIKVRKPVVHTYIAAYNDH